MPLHPGLEGVCTGQAAEKGSFSEIRSGVSSTNTELFQPPADGEGPSKSSSHHKQGSVDASASAVGTAFVAAALQLQRSAESQCRRRSLDSGLTTESMSFISSSASISTLRLSMALWPAKTMSVFALQQEVANAHAEGSISDSESATTGGSTTLGASVAWHSSGQPFAWLGGMLKVVGTLCFSRPLAAGRARPLPAPPSAKRYYVMSLLYMLMWQVACWAIVVFHCSRAATLGVKGLAQFSAAVRGLSLLACACAHASSVRFFAGGTFADLVHYATRSDFVRCWSASSWQAALAQAVPLLALTVASAAAEGIGPLWLAYTIAWLPVMVQYHLFLTTIKFCSLGLDAFALNLLNTHCLQGLVGRFDKLHAAMRRSAYAVQASLTVFVTILFALLFACMYHLAFPGLNGGGSTATTGDTLLAPWATASNSSAVISVAVLFLLGLHLLNQIATVNAKSKRLPVLIHSLNFGHEIDHDKWCVSAHIASLEAGFFVYNVPVTRWSVLKFLYFAIAATSFLLTRLVFQAS